MTPRSTVPARAYLATVSRQAEPLVRLGITVGLVAAALAVAEIVSTVYGGGRFELVAIGTALGLAPLACALHRGNRRSSSGFDVSLDISPSGIRCAELFGAEEVERRSLLGAYVATRSPEPIVVLTTHQEATWVLELENARAAEALVSALGLPAGLSGRVRFSVRSKAPGFGCLRALPAILVIGLWFLSTNRRAVQSYVLLLGVLVAVLPILIGLFVEFADAAAYETLTVSERGVHIEGRTERLLSEPIEAVTRAEALELRSGNRAPVRVYEAELMRIPALPLVARCIKAVGDAGGHPPPGPGGAPPG